MPAKRAPRISAQDARLSKLAQICAALPEVTRRDDGDHAAFLVGKKIFTYFLNNHHGDGIVSVVCKVSPGDNAALIAAQPDRFHMPAYIGPRGWVGLRLDLDQIDWEEVAELVGDSYRRIAPKRLAAIAR